MKNLILSIIIIFSLTIFFYPNYIISNNGGSPGGKTGSPTDNSTCQACHYAGLGSGGMITTNIPASGYIPGNTYTITASVTDNSSSKFGFEITSEDDNVVSAKTGNFLITNSTETQSTNNNTAVTHRGGGTAGTNNSKSWSIDWIAPGWAASSGGVIFYASFMATNGDGTNMGDIYHAAELYVNEGTGTTINEEEDNIFLTMKNRYLEIQSNRLMKDINIYNIEGKIVYNNPNISNNHQRINLNGLKTGIYTVLFTDKNNKKISKKVMLN